jgi:wyosine [tRNA(Phe)-imidazoG37] synthetase (radical SAM superfamily)
MPYVFGPVPSRRLGQSLGVDPLPLKVCNWNCVYCQLGRTVPLCNERREFFPREDILAEVRTVLAGLQPGAADWITIVGSGETTLHSGIGWLIREIKSLTDIPVSVITNGSLLHLAEVRQDLLAADAVLPSLDAGNAGLYRAVNRPAPGLSFELLLEGLASFRREYRGSLWLEVMLIKDVNDGEEALREIASAVERIQPDQVHIAIPVRPPAEPDIRRPDEEGLRRAAAILGSRARVIPPAGGALDLSGHQNVGEAVLAVISRHPVEEKELRRELERWTPGQVEEALRLLADCGAAQVVERCGERFWSAAGCRYPSLHTTGGRAPGGSPAAARGTDEAPTDENH